MELTIGKRIREMRLAAGMSQEQLAEALCTKKCTISAYETDKIDIKSSILKELQPSFIAVLPIYWKEIKKRK